MHARSGLCWLIELSVIWLWAVPLWPSHLQFINCIQSGLALFKKITIHLLSIGSTFKLVKQAAICKTPQNVLSPSSKLSSFITKAYKLSIYKVFSVNLWDFWGHFTLLKDLLSPVFSWHSGEVVKAEICWILALGRPRQACTACLSGPHVKTGASTQKELSNKRMSYRITMENFKNCGCEFLFSFLFFLSFFMCMRMRNPWNIHLFRCINHHKLKNESQAAGFCESLEGCGCFVPNFSMMHKNSEP